jgi:hypothetical protein
MSNIGDTIVTTIAAGAVGLAALGIANGILQKPQTPLPMQKTETRPVYATKREKTPTEELIELLKQGYFRWRDGVPRQPEMNMSYAPRPSYLTRRMMPAHKMERTNN